MKLAILFLMFCAIILLANAKRKKCPHVRISSILRRLLRTEKWGWRGRTYIILKLRNNWCKRPRDISYGKIETPCGLGLGMMAKYSCNEGYKLLPKRYKERKCLSVRSSWRWSRGTARCRADCGPLPQLENGHIEQNSTMQGATARYVCNPTYTLTAASTERTCLRNRTYSGEPATCIKCVDLTAPINGFLTHNGSAVDAVADYSCEIGFQLKGPKSRSCSITGNWTGTAPICELIECAHLSSPLAGSVTQNGSAVGAVADYSCVAGYQLKGPISRSCSITGNWTGTKPICELIGCANLADPIFGSVSQTGTKVGAIADYSCETGYQLSGSQSRFCLLTGNWTGTEPVCEPVGASKCATLSSPLAGTVTQNGSMVGAVADYSCVAGYRLKGPKSRSCSLNGSWTYTEPICELIECANLSAPMFGSVLSQSGTIVGAIADYSCETGYQLSGSQSRSCSITGSWTGIEPICEPIGESKCTTLSPPISGNVSQSGTMVGAIADYSCEAGYQLTGSKSRFCAMTGNWTGTEPQCKPIDCGLPEPPCDGKVVPDVPGKTTIGYNVTYSCDSGYFLSGGSTKRTCTLTGWDGGRPSCIKGCDFSGNTYFHGDYFQTDGGCHNCTCGYGSVTCTGGKACDETRTVSQSTEHSTNPRPAIRAIDGDFGTIAATDHNEATPWWMLEYECAQTFIAVVITQRRDFSYVDRGARKLVIYVDDQICGRLDKAPWKGENRVIKCPVPLTGKRLKIVKTIKEPIALAEVEPILYNAKGC